MCGIGGFDPEGAKADHAVYDLAEQPALDVRNDHVAKLVRGADLDQSGIAARRSVDHGQGIGHRNATGRQQCAGKYLVFGNRCPAAVVADMGHGPVQVIRDIGRALFVGEIVMAKQAVTDIFDHVQPTMGFRHPAEFAVNLQNRAATVTGGVNQQVLI